MFSTYFKIMSNRLRIYIAPKNTLNKAFFRTQLTILIRLKRGQNFFFIPKWFHYNNIDNNNEYMEQQLVTAHTYLMNCFKFTHKSFVWACWETVCCQWRIILKYGYLFFTCKYSNTIIAFPQVSNNNKIRMKTALYIYYLYLVQISITDVRIFA